ncbi:HMP-PP phosphatase [Sodalis praecaptivus]|nr:HMP-PP phosphatase [Sodalis praecaptivus]
MAIKLIAIDMDGTLLNHKHEITPAVKEAIGAARGKGVYVALATGRPYIGIERYLMELDLQVEGNFCITNNGALVQRTGRVFRKRCWILTITATWRLYPDSLRSISTRWISLRFTPQIAILAVIPFMRPH